MHFEAAVKVVSKKSFFPVNENKGRHYLSTEISAMVKNIKELA